MKATIIVLAVLGAAAGGFLGAKWVSDAAKYQQVIAQVSELGIAPEAVAQAKALTTAGYLLLAGALVAVPAAIASIKMQGKELIFGAVLIGCAAAPAVFAAKSLVFTVFLVIAGGLAIVRGLKSSPAAARRPEMAGAY